MRKPMPRDGRAEDVSYPAQEQEPEAAGSKPCTLEMQHFGYDCGIRNHPKMASNNNKHKLTLTVSGGQNSGAT
jgi:hypothetical protein